MAVICTSFQRSSRSLDTTSSGYCWLSWSLRALNLKSKNLSSPNRDEDRFKQISSLSALRFWWLFVSAFVSWQGRGPAKRSIKSWGLIFSWCWMKILLARLFERRVLDESLRYSPSWFVFLMTAKASSYILLKVSSQTSKVTSTTFLLII